MIKKIPLEEILNRNSLRDKEYLVREIDLSCNNNLVTAELQCKAVDGNTIYVGSQRFSKIDADKSRKIYLDEEGLPYFKRSLGPVTYQIYEEIFIGNDGFAAAMGRENQNLLLKILKKVKEENHFVYQKFKEYIGQLIKKTPKIKEAKDKKHFFGDQTDLNKFPELDLKIFEYLAVEDRRAYTISLFKKNYKDQVEDPFEKESKALEKWILHVAKKLEEKGFKKVEQFKRKDI